MDLEQLREHIDGRFDRLNDKLDDHLGRISKAEASIEWLRGHARTSLTLLVTAVVGMAAAIYHLLGGK